MGKDNKLDNDALLDINSSFVDDIDNTNEKKKKAQEEKEQRRLEIKEKLKSTNILPISIIIVLLIAVLVIYVSYDSKLRKEAVYTINVIEPGVIVAQQAKFEEPKNIHNNASATDNSQYNIVDLANNGILKPNNTVMMNIIVNTKESWEESMSNHDAYYYMTFKGYETDYDKVVNAVNEFNENGKSSIKLPDKAQLDENGLRLAYIEFEISYPDDFPTYNSDGMVYTFPSLKFDIVSTESSKIIELAKSDKKVGAEMFGAIYNEDGTVDFTGNERFDKYVLVDDLLYKIDTVYDLYHNLKEAEKTEKYSYKYIMVLPENIEREQFYTTIQVKDKQNTKNFNIEGFTFK